MSNNLARPMEILTGGSEISIRKEPVSEGHARGVAQFQPPLLGYSDAQSHSIPTPNVDLHVGHWRRQSDRSDDECQFSRLADKMVAELRDTHMRDVREAQTQQQPHSACHPFRRPCQVLLWAL